MEKVYLTWEDIEALIAKTLPKLKELRFDAVLAITRGGIIPGGIIAERLGVTKVFVASVDFYSDEENDMDFPVFMQFPVDSLLRGEHILVVDDLWDRGREVTSVRERVEHTGGKTTTFVMHYKPHRSIYPDSAPDFYTAKTKDWIIYPWELNRDRYSVS